MEGDLLPIDDEGPENGRRQESVGQINLTCRDRVEDEFDQAGSTLIGTLQIPMPVDDASGIGLLLGKDVIERVVHLRKLRLAQFALAPESRIAGRSEECILLAQGYVERGGEIEHG